MFIREDLEEVIKDKFNVEKFSYIGIRKNAFNDDLFVYDTGKGFIAIEVGFFGYHPIYEAKEISEHPGYFYKDSLLKRCYLYISSKEKTCLEINRVITNLPGKAFDCTSELVLLAMENS